MSPKSPDPTLPPPTHSGLLAAQQAGTVKIQKREVKEPSNLREKVCATCGKNLHEPDAMTTTPLIAPVTSKRSKPDFIIGAEIFAILLIGLFFFLHIGIRTGWIPAWIPGHPFGSPIVVYLFLIGIIIWAELYDRV